MRITGGASRGRIISGPQGLEARPTASKIRQAFFNILSSRIRAARVLDLCAGTGLMGIEALSRGASEVIFVEESRRLARSIEQNLQRLGYEAEVICGDVRKVMPALEPDRFDIVFADPPYKSRLALTIVREVARNHLLAPDGVLAVEHARGADLSYEEAGLYLYDRREYGQTCVSFYRRRHEHGPDSAALT
ncbi:MAG TPA: 16S rRNA (guanine(966)-N(2))-methyltransferase RsmD [Candidatus Obscuribacterales bacterium]